MHVSAYVCVCVCVCVCAHAHTHTCVRACVCVCLCVLTFVRVCNISHTCKVKLARLVEYTAQDRAGDKMT